jgi:hypothetical protein
MTFPIWLLLVFIIAIWARLTSIDTRMKNMEYKIKKMEENGGVK